MGLADSQARLLMLCAYKSDLEFGMAMIAQKRTMLAYQAQLAGEMYPELANQLHVMDKRLDLEMKTLETQYKIVNTEFDSVNKIVEDRTKKDFKYA
ncbi:MAG TPA: hypothetical protein P5556_10145 [Candidatus Gastranaerophilales bacterium]|nr:hypothetical protein [Candidatus Gastranaerophilales bacterium]